MPRIYIKKTNRTSIDEQEVKKAIIDIFNNVKSIEGASEFYNIKRQTLQSRIKEITAVTTKEDWLKKDSGQESEEEKPSFADKYAARQVFNVMEEQKLAEYIKNCSELHYGMNYEQIQELAFEYATRLGKDMPANWKLNGLAGIEWIRGFIGRQKNLSLRKPESTSLARAKGFNKVAVDDFFEKYTNVMEKGKFTARKIYNIDECGVTTVMKPVKIVAEKGKKQVGIATSAERGELVTFVGIINAAGGFLPPCHVYPRLRNPQEYLRDEYPDSLASGSKNGWMTPELFPVVIDHIIKIVKPTQEDNILLLLNNHD
ncbi:uncharacterized protein LOC120352518 [Nilaparvata lugens]|uniref:uncharacterized protein LOC120352518 n=1 Tax=Nilaparvata lugens TaxID=108931 RepID=UPI00193D034E|nr:uncharacterized protein LOC120352518 [Nilaparvata lugens]